LEILEILEILKRFRTASNIFEQQKTPQIK